MVTNNRMANSVDAVEGVIFFYMDGDRMKMGDV